MRWRVGTAFGAAGILGAYAGTLLNRRLDEDLLLLGFALVMGLAAAAVLRQGEPRPRHRSTAATVAYVALTGLGSASSPGCSAWAAASRSCPP